MHERLSIVGEEKNAPMLAVTNRNRNAESRSDTGSSCQEAGLREHLQLPTIGELKNSQPNPRLDLMVRVQSVFPELDLGVVGTPNRRAG